VDTISRELRSEVMRRIRAKNTEPEMVVRNMVWSMGRRYRLHVRKLPGCPDLVFARDHKIIFVHGCFWHPHPGCTVGHTPRSRVAYWQPKLEGNRRRDQRNQRKLRRAGWSVLTIRECELDERDRLVRRLAAFLKCAVPPLRSRTFSRSNCARTLRH
jgi:DNA mismatch endonuclease (patch repair protein)